MALPTALLDANVLYPAGLRDFLLRLADQYLYAPRWSMDIHAEWIRSVLANRPDLTVDMLERTSTVMDRHFPDAVVTGYSARAAGLDLPDPDDIHVLAAAIEAGADTIVTWNLRDFPSERLAPHDLTAKHPDVFIADLFVADPEAVLTAVRGHRAALRNPPRTANEHVDALERLGLIRTASLVRPHRNRSRGRRSADCEVACAITYTLHTMLNGAPWQDRRRYGTTYFTRRLRHGCRRARA